MLLQGRSFSGRERHCCFLNLGQNPNPSAFANISATSGLDLPDDGRAVARVDWDQDGDQDLWISNRNAPRLRFMRNETPTDNHWVALKPRGNGTTTNRDAIGARVIITNPKSQNSNPKSIKTLRAGEGLLSQSSKWLHFGLGQTDRIEKVVVDWPGGNREEFTNLKVNQRYVLRQGSGECAPVKRRQTLSLAVSEPEIPPATDQARIPLITPIELPNVPVRGLDGSRGQIKPRGGRHLLINLWSITCSPCLAELSEFTQREQDLRGAEIEVVALNVDGIEGNEFDPAATSAVIKRIDFPFSVKRASAEAVAGLQHFHDLLVPMRRPLPLPSSLLFDAQGRLAVIYKGPVSVDDLLRDTKHSSRTRVERFEQAAPIVGVSLRHEIADRAMINAEKELRMRFATGYERAGIPDLAIVQYEHLVTIDPSAEVHNKLAKMLIGRNEIAAAKKHLEQALSIDRGHADAHNNLGNIFFRSKQFKEAKRHYQRAAESRDDYAEYQSNLGNVTAVQNQLDEAIKHYERALEINPNYGQAHFNLALVLERQERVAEAIDQLKKALKFAESQRLTELDSKIRRRIKRLATRSPLSE